MMNHRSQVRSVIYGPENLMMEFLKEFEEPIKLVVYEGIVEQTLVGDDIVLHLHDADIQWNHDLPAVSAWLDLLSEAEDMGLAYEHIELGSEYFETLTRSAGPSRGLISLVRKTQPNFGTTL